MKSEITKAVIPAAGLGTRFLPATKAIPKEMLPVVDRPAIQYVVEEASDAGIRDVLIITGRNKAPLENHFDRVAELEDNLTARNKTIALKKVRRAAHLADVHYVRQGEPKGLGHAILRARKHVGKEPFAALLGDDIIDDGADLLREMSRIHFSTGASVIAVQQVPNDKVSAYGIIHPGSECDTGRWQSAWVQDLIEKPAKQDAPSNLAAIGRYVLRPEVFDVLEHTMPGTGGEIQLTDALRDLAKDSEQYGGVIAVVYQGRRFDTGNKLEYLKANVELALRDDEIGEPLRRWLQETVIHSQDNPEAPWV